MKLIQYLKFKKPIINVGFFIMLTITLISCGADDDPTVMDVDYLPIEVGNSWTFSNPEDPEMQGTISITGITTLSDGRTATVAAVDDGGGSYQDKGYLSKTADDLLLIHSAIDDIQGQLLYMPSIKIGTRWEGEDLGAEVVARETVKTPAGVFQNCFRIDILDDGEGYAAVWLANNVGPVKIAELLNGYSLESVAFSPDGKTIIAAATSRNSKINVIGRWNVNTGKHLSTTLIKIIGSGWDPNAGFSPDGRKLATRGYDTVRLWDVTTGQVTAVFTEHAQVRSVSFSPDGRTIVSGSDDGTLRLWDVTTGENINTFTGHRGGTINSVSFSPDGRTIVSGSDDESTLRLWDVTTGENINTFTGHTDTINSVSFSPDGGMIVSGSSDDTVRLWDVETGENINTFTGHTDTINSVSFSPDGRTIASGSSDDTVRLWDVATGENINTFAEYIGYRSVISFSPDGRTIAISSNDDTLRLWDVETGENLHIFEDPSGIVGESVVLEKYNFR